MRKSFPGRFSSIRLTSFLYWNWLPQANWPVRVPSRPGYHHEHSIFRIISARIPETNSAAEFASLQGRALEQCQPGPDVRGPDHHGAHAFVPGRGDAQDVGSAP